MKGTKSSAHNQLISPAGSPPSDNDSGRGGGGDATKENDRFLPIANVSRIMKKSLPSNAKISKEAKETVQECVSEFINFVTGEASDKCQREKRKTINGDDLLWAMTTLGFDSYVVPLKSYLSRYREGGGDQYSIMKGQQMSEEGKGGGGGGSSGGGGADEVGGVGGLCKGTAGPTAPGFPGGNGFYGRSDDGRGSFHGVHW
ncbi:nuclear transcription factor Y subunit B-3 [Dendrobium catenatum]|uniref:Nuclear transcription factor Y subunit B-3 n=1 Tax=Dendrobium catenatum TaxID=906689 RepID=A0A2I0W735_9ASPA|nr:nuclear transcription factor Y subunit B-3 [Dendrobium catenatum]PKU71460.1 Nuclear transcription factor Y subunit B-3 [Dendrobium catenatum]